MAKSWQFIDSRNSDHVTARLHQFATFKLGQGIVSSDGFNSETRGYRDFNRKKCFISKHDIEGYPTHYECIDLPEETVLGYPVHKELFGKNNKTNTYIYMQIEGSNELTTFGMKLGNSSLTPDIDCLLICYADIISENTIKFLHLRGVILYKGFPAYESFIEDQSGNKVFIHTFGPESESTLECELIFPSYDYIKRVEMKIRINSSGEFINDNLKIGIDQNSYSNLIDFGAILNDPLSHPNLKTPNFTFITTTITSWNDENFSKAPAGDCFASPCEGTYPGDN